MTEKINPTAPVLFTHVILVDIIFIKKSLIHEIFASLQTFE